MHTLGIDAFSSRPERTGVEWYTDHLLRAMRFSRPPEWRVFLYSLDASPEIFSPSESDWQWRKLSWPPRRGWGQIRLSWEMLWQPPEVLFLPHSPIPPVHPPLTVVTIHDLGFLLRPDLYAPADYKRQIWALKLARQHTRLVLAVSEATRQDLIDRVGFAPGQILVTPLGVDSSRYRSNYSLEEQKGVLEKYHLSQPYFLYVGRLDAKKNLLTLIRAWARARKNKKLGMLVLVGSPGFRFEEIKIAVAEAGVGEEVKFLNYVPEDDLPLLYLGARAFVFPSAVEGFGLPVLEALAVGRPVICSDLPALREVAGQAAIFIRPDDEEEWSLSLIRLAEDETLGQHLGQEGLIRASQFSWSRTAKLTWQGICGIINSDSVH